MLQMVCCYILHLTRHYTLALLALGSCYILAFCSNRGYKVHHASGYIRS